MSILQPPVSASVRLGSCFLLRQAMEEQDHTVEYAAARFEIIHSLDRAVDLAYRRLIAAAKSEWERRFAGKEPSDACVTVRISSPQTQQAVRGSAFLERTAAPSKKRNLPLPRFAR